MVDTNESMAMRGGIASVVVLLLLWAGVAGAASKVRPNPQYGVRARCGSAITFQPYLWLGGGGVYGGEALARLTVCPKLDMELGVGALYGSAGYPFWRVKKSQGCSILEVSASVSWRRWMRLRNAGWYYRAGWMLNLQVWGTRWSLDDDGKRTQHSLPVGYVLNLEEEGVKLAPLVPTLTFEVGYRWPNLPLEVGLELGRDLLLRLEPFSKNPIFSLMAASYVGGAVAWWF